MAKSNKKKLIFKCCLAVLLIVAVAASAVFAIIYTPADVKIIRNVKTRSTFRAASVNPELHYAKSASAFKDNAAASGLVELNIDPDSKSFCITEPATGRLWSALPLLSDAPLKDELHADASIATLRVLIGSDIHYLNTQDNSLAYNKASYKKITDGARFTFDVFADSDTAKKKTYGKDDVGFRIELDVTLKDGSLRVNCTHSNLTGNKNAFIENVELLNYFGAYNESFEDDFLLVPDGCGAIIKTAIYDESFESLSFAVYGSDPSFSNKATGSAIIPAFGIKHGDTAFVSLIEKGDAAATVNADKATSINEYNRVYSTFTVNPSVYKNKKVYISKESVVDEFSLCYRFLSGNNATYAGLASACREQLIRNSVLSTKAVTVDDYLPCFLSLTGAVTGKKGPFETVEPFTTYEQATDMLTHMKSKGINNISVRYSGVFDSGVNSENSSSLKLNSETGSREELASLYDYAKSQKMKIYLDLNLISSAGGYWGNNALSLSKNDTEYMPDYVKDDYFDTKIKERKLCDPENITDYVKAMIKDTADLSFSGFCLNDAGTVLYSDFTKGGMLRQSVANTVANAIIPLSTEKDTMAVTGNFYMLKNVDSIVNMPLKTTASVSGAYVSIPFVPLVLHGIVDYTGEPINTQVNIDETLLKYVEYGACPHFEWSYEPVGESENDVYYYDNTINTAAEYYSEVDSILNDLRDARMTDHYEVADGIFCTEYDTGTLIYVNYTDSDFETLGVTVEARSFIRIN